MPVQHEKPCFLGYGPQDHALVNVIKFRTLSYLDKMLAFMAGIHKTHVRITNRKDPDQTASSEAV